MKQTPPTYDKMIKRKQNRLMKKCYGPV